MKIAFLTAGGIAPCLSASIGALIQRYNDTAPEAELIGYLNGYRGLLIGEAITFPSTVREQYSTLYDFGGSPIGNSRVKLTNVEDCIERGYVQDGENPLKVAADQLTKDGIDILHTIGGDDTNTMAAQLSFYLKENGYRVDGIGWQAHLKDFEKLALNKEKLDFFTSLIDWSHRNGLDFHVTEMDYRINNCLLYTSPSPRDS